jgi:hypothetical protein
LVPNTEVISLAHILWSTKSVANPPFFDITLPREVVPFLSDNPQTELPKREVIDSIPGE